MSSKSQMEEVAFWRRILRDHAVFTRDNLGPSEREAVAEAEELRTELEGRPAEQPVEATVEAAGALIAFQSQLLARLTDCQLTIHLHATDLSHMIKEAEEFLRTVGVLPRPATPFSRLLHLHGFWLEDAAFHSTFLAGVLDPNEYLWREQFMQFERILTQLFLKARHQMEVYERIGGQAFAAARGLTQESERVTGAHLRSLERLEGLTARCEAEIAAPPLLADHMLREERYYLAQVAEVSA